MKKIIFLVLIASFFSACATQSVEVGSVKQLAHGEVYPRYKETKHYFLWGAISSDIGKVNTAIPLVKICRSEEKVVKFERKITHLNALFTIFTLGIYSPYTNLVYCRT